ncbi:MAG: C40 family peptidase [Candidatus Brennerbacteria bacterium]
MTETQKEKLISLARGLVGKPYEYGAKPEDAPNVFDCSSFIQYIFKNIDIELPRSSILQAADQKGKTIVPAPDLSSLEPGDLLFMTGVAGHYDDELFDGVRHYIGHVALYLGNGSIIQAKKSYGEVREGTLSEFIKDPHYRIELIKRF